MDSVQRDQLEQEQVVGKRAKVAYENFIQAFIEQKKAMLLESFTKCATSDVDMILEIKRTLYVLDALELDVKSIVDTGKMASQALYREPMEKH